MSKLYNYIENRFAPVRRFTHEVKVGDIFIGGQNPIVVQSMTNTSTQDIQKTVAQTLALARSGCELVRITAPTVKDAQCLKEIVSLVRKEGVKVPFCADIHFQPKAAMEALKWVEKVRINPGNFVDIKTSVEMESREYDDVSYKRGAQRVFDVFSPFVKEAKKNGVCIRIGTNHGSLSDRMLARFGDSVEGMVESALEYLDVCESESYKQVVFSMKASNPKIVIQAYRLLAAKLNERNLHHPFHLGVTEAGEGEDGRLKSAVGIGALLLDGIGDTVRVSLTEDPVAEIPVAKELVKICEPSQFHMDDNIPEKEYIDHFNSTRRKSNLISLGNYANGETKIGGRETILVGTEVLAGEIISADKNRPVEWAIVETEPKLKTPFWLKANSVSVGTQIQNAQGIKYLSSELTAELLSKLDSKLTYIIEVVDFTPVSEWLKNTLLPAKVIWSISPVLPLVPAYRKLSALLSKYNREDCILVQSNTDGSSGVNMLVAAQMGSVFSDGIGDLIQINHAKGWAQGIQLGYDILQSANVRKTKTDYVSCPSCGRTLFDLESTTAKIRKVTSHLGNVSIAIMGCIVNGPGEMADADFGYVGGAPGKVNLYVGYEVVEKNIPEAEAPDLLVELIKKNGKWKEPED